MSSLRTESEGNVVIEEMKAGELEVLLDREARELLNITGVEFAAKWAAGEYVDADDPRITDLAMLLP